MESYRTVFTYRLKPVCYGEKTEPFVNSVRDWKIYPTHGEDWSYTPEGVWNPNSGACYPGWHVDKSLKLQIDDMWS